VAHHNDQRPILIAYDGSDYAKEAIKQAGEHLRDGLRAIVLTVWQPPVATAFMGAPLPDSVEQDVEHEALRLADEGCRLARRAGFEATPLAERGDPTWERIVEVADEQNAGIVVMGSHGRTGISRLVMGSVATTAASHTDRPVLIAHRHDGQ
jgi:nucleotide-binding universal stress UspA family protein